MLNIGIQLLLTVGAICAAAEGVVIVCSNVKSTGNSATCRFDNIKIGFNETDDVIFKVDEREAFENDDISIVQFGGSDNKMEKFPSTIFRSFKFLTGLSIPNARIETVDNHSFIDAKYLKDLDLEENLLNKLPDDLFKNAINLETVNLNGNPIAGTFNVSIFNGLPLKKVFMKNTSITKLVGSFGEGSVLTVLNLTQNKIQWIDPSVFQYLGNLEDLALNENPLSILRANQFYGITRLIDSSLKLNYLSIKWMDASCFNGMQLKIINLVGNKLTVINAYQFQPVDSLTELYLNKNQLRTLDKKSFYGLDNLKYLDLADNDLVLLPGGVFDGLLLLNWLILSNNKIKYLQPTIFADLLNLGQLEMENNQLKYFSDVTISYSAPYSRINLNNNQLMAVIIEHLTGKLKFNISLKQNICVDYEHLTSDNWSELLKQIKNCSVVDYYANQVEQLMDMYDHIGFDLINKLESLSNIF